MRGLVSSSGVDLGCERLLPFALRTLPLLLTFLTEAFPAVLTYVRFFPRVELHVVPQRARVRQQLWAERALNLWDQTKPSLEKFLRINPREGFKHSQHRFSEQRERERSVSGSLTRAVY